MKNLENKHKGQSALMIMGGQSLMHNVGGLKKLAGKGFSVFLEAKALTPEFLKLKIAPDYYFAPYPEKMKDNALQNFIFRSFLASVNIKKYIRKEYFDVVDDMQDNFNDYYENWRPHKGMHKRYRMKDKVYLKDSPYSLLGKIPDASIITDKSLLDTNFPDFNYKNNIHYFNLKNEPYDFRINEYYKVYEDNDEVYLNGMNSMNSAAITLYPILNYMGFSQVYLLGMDMTMLGTMEYSVGRIFKSMFHYWLFFNKANKAFNACFKRNFPFYYRPKSEFKDIRTIMRDSDMRITRVYNKDKHVAPIPNGNVSTYSELLNL